MTLGWGLSQCDSRELGWLLSDQNTALGEDGGLFSGIVGISAKQFCHHQYGNPCLSCDTGDYLTLTS